MPVDLQTTNLNDENEVFAAWNSSSGEDRYRYQQVLCKLLMKHAHSVCWQKLPDLQSEHNWISNESVSRALMRSKNFKGRSKFSTWFHRIVLNECNRILKRKQRRAEVPLEDVAEDSVAHSSPADGEILLQQVSSLAGQKDRRILELIKQGYSSREIAVKLRISKDSVRKRWERLRTKLRGLLEGPAGI